MDTVTFSALAEPSRLRIVELLRNGPLNVGEVAAQLDIRQPQASKHLKVLLEAGLVEVHAEANRRNYKLRTAPLQHMDNWLSAYRTMWEQRHDKLDHYLHQLQMQQKQSKEEL